MVIKEHLKTRFSNLKFEFRRNLKKKNDYAEDKYLECTGKI